MWYIQFEIKKSPEVFIEGHKTLVMKFNFLKIAFVFVACLMFGFSVQAQRGGKMTPEKFDAHMERMTTALELNKRQVKKVTKIEQEYFASMEALRAEMPRPERVKRPASQEGNANATRPARDPQMAERNKMRREKMRMINNNHNNALKAVLTPAQFEKYTAAKEKRNNKMRERVRAAKAAEKAAKEPMQKQSSGGLK